jgi:hypothetical protein
MKQKLSSQRPTKWLARIVGFIFAGSVAMAYAANLRAPQPVLVELFTSEGCSSCPPADRLLMELDRQQPVVGASVIVLSEHVDYWNNLGWHDPYSSHQWSERQSDYARRFGLDSVYTPQIVVAGAHQVLGSDAQAVRRAVEASIDAHQIQIDISSVERAAGSLEFTFNAAGSPRSTLYAAVADEADHSSVHQGENAGRSLDHVSVLRSLEPVATLQTSPVEMKVTIKLPPDIASRHLRLILFAQDNSDGHICGVAVHKL